MSSELSLYLYQQKKKIDEALTQWLYLENGHRAELLAAARHALLGEGKRIRPILTLACVSTFQKNPDEALPAACALELVHTYSMIHDDLPCMDNDDFRRGKPTVHRQFSEAMAVLAGDFLLTYAFELLASDPFSSDAQKVRLMALLAKQSGSEGMIGGQVMDLHYEGKAISLETLTLLHTKKTAALITCALEFGAIIAKVSSADFLLLQRFGWTVGLAFQIIDDILDVTASETKHGRGLSSDMRNQKSTFVSLLGIEEAKAYAKNLQVEAHLLLQSLSVEAKLLQNLADFILSRNY